MEKKTLSEAKREVIEGRLKGIKCPCCNQHVRLYKRNITSAMAYALIIIHRSGNTSFFHIENYFKKINCPASIRGDFPKLRFWGLIEKKSDLRPDGSNRNGYYRITGKGRDFVNNNITVLKYLYLYNNKVQATEPDELVNIHTCLTQKFNYNELMNPQHEIVF